MRARWARISAWRLEVRRRQRAAAPAGVDDLERWISEQRANLHHDAAAWIGEQHRDCAVEPNHLRQHAIETNEVADVQLTCARGGHSVPPSMTSVAKVSFVVARSASSWCDQSMWKMVGSNAIGSPTWLAKAPCEIR